MPDELPRSSVIDVDHASAPTKSPASARLIPVLFFLSGACSLIFENLWQRLMTLEFGASSIATTAILTSFFFGVAWGSYLGGKLLVRFPSAFSFYWRVELAIGLFGIAVPWMLSLTRMIYLALAEPTSASLALGFFVRFLLAVLVTLPASLAMGATIPAMNRILVETNRSVGRSVALAYGLNTLGAVLGCLATGLVFVPLWGVARTLWLAACINGLIALTARGYARASFIPASDLPGVESENRPEPLRHPRLITWAYFIAGAVALGLEVTWMRILAIYCTSSTLTFTLALAVYLSGFGLGSLMLFPVLAKCMSGRAVFTTSNIGAGISTLAAIPLVYRFPALNEQLLLQPARQHLLSLERVAGTELVLAMILMFLPTLFLGLGFPGICRALVANPGRTSQTTGRLYFLGTLGSMLGVLLTGLFAIPNWGFIVTLNVLCGTITFLGVLIEYCERRQTRLQAALVTGVLLLTAAGIAAFAVKGHPFTEFPYDVLEAGTDYANRRPGMRLVRYAEGLTGTVSVVDFGPPGSEPVRELTVDWKSVAGTNQGALSDSKMLAHIPLLLHPNPQNALTVGFGTGGTSWSLTRYPIQADCAEIEREIIRSAPWFRMQNFNVLEHPRFHLILDDARGHLFTTRTRYDVISTDCTQLHYKHNSSLYTVEYFELMKNRLTDKGVACAWVPVAGISEDDFKILLRSFQHVFPHATMWYMNQTITAFAVLIGTTGPLQIDIQRIESACQIADVRNDLETIGIEAPEQLLDFLHLDESGYAAFVGDGPLHTDDHPILEFSSPTFSLSIGQLRARNMRSSMKFRIAGDSVVFADWPDEQRLLARRRIESAGQMTEAIIKCFEAEVVDDPRAAADSLRAAVDDARRAVGPFRNEDSRMLVLGELIYRWQQRLAEHPELRPENFTRENSTREPFGQINEDFDGPVRLPLYPQIERFRPAASPLNAWEVDSRVEDLKRRDAYVRGAGVNHSVGLEIRPVAHANVVSYFCPLSVAANRALTVTFSCKTELKPPATAGLAVVEFDIDVQTPEQIPEDVFKQHVVAVRPITCDASGDWEQFSRAFTTTNRTRMVHLVFFLDRAGEGDRVVFDNVTVEQSD